MLHDLKKSHFYDLKLIFLNFPPVPLCSPESRVRFFRSAEAPASVAYIKEGSACIQQPCLNIRVTIVSPENVPVIKKNPIVIQKNGIVGMRNANAISEIQNVNRQNVIVR